ncbi:hypothetical protein [Bordetella sp. N]|uniref:hypothetical protein n=1 Tax=Bordetella sp. N TaxID=1746199 RepID=UPI000709B802|nr:hypothetical protein [Bordetella sp. N]ALM85777.1 hypothetical protein ASB57_24990 [Bordetella sp. N]
MKRVVVGLLFSLLMFGAALCFFGAATSRGLIYFPGLGIDPADLGKLLVLIGLLVMPFMVTLQIDAARGTRSTRYAVLLSLVILLAFPLPFEGRRWSYAMNADGTPMIDETFKTPVKSWDAFLGYAPFWKSRYVKPTAHPAYTRDNHTREVDEGNALWGSRTTYKLYANIGSDDYECRSSAAFHLLGFYYDDQRDGRGEEEVTLDKDTRCQTVKLDDGVVDRDQPVIAIPVMPGR